MFEYLMSNKEWIFSGAGVVALSTISAIIWRLAKKKAGPPTPQVIVVQASQTHGSSSTTAPALKSSETPVATPAPITRITPISISEIRETVSDAPPLQKNQVAKNYEGLHVEWDSKLSNAETKGGDNVLLLLVIGGPIGEYIYCEVKLSDYKELGILKKGAPIRVTGRIKKVKDAYLELDEVQLFFTPPSEGASS